MRKKKRHSRGSVFEIDGQPGKDAAWTPLPFDYQVSFSVYLPLVEPVPPL
jgi:hypothetical protein